MMQRSFLRIVPLSLLLTGLSAASARGQETCTAVVVHGIGGPTLFVDGFESGGTLAWEKPALPAFSTVRTLDLTVEVSLDAALAGDHLLTLAWRLPGGSLYQSVAVPFTVDAGVGATGASGATGTSGASAAISAVPSRRIEGYPFPVQTRIARRSSASGPGMGPGGGLVVEDRLPVAGTSIVESALWGDWSLDVRLDDEEIVCATAGFRMEP